MSRNPPPASTRTPLDLFSATGRSGLPGYFSHRSRSSETATAVAHWRAAGPAVVAWLLALAGAALTLVRRAYGPLLCALSGGLLALVTAFSANNFGSAVLPFAGPADLDRAAVALALGGGAGLFLAGFAALRELTPAEPATATPEEPGRVP